jgi:ATP-dependent DNA helicase RecQ
VGHFGGEARPCGRCDACTAGAAVEAAVGKARRERAETVRENAAKRARDRAVTLDEAQRDTILRFVDGLRRPVGRKVLAQALRGGRSKRAVRLGLPNNPQFGALRGLPEIAIVGAVDDLLEEGKLARKGKKYPTVWLPEKRVRSAAGTRPKAEPTGLRAALREFRRREARRRRWKPYQVFPDATMDAIVQSRPTSAADLLEIKGMGPARIEKFSHGILELVRSYPE